MGNPEEAPRKLATAKYFQRGRQVPNQLNGKNKFWAINLLSFRCIGIIGTIMVHYAGVINLAKEQIEGAEKHKTIANDTWGVPLHF